MIEHFKQSGCEFLSNFQRVDIIFEGNKYHSVEHAYQAAKTNAIEWRTFCITCESPSKIKAASKEIQIRSDWNEVRVAIMRNLLEQKFEQEPYRTRLLNTGTQYIQEGNYWGDTFWGVDMTKTPPSGKNILGQMLMDIRDRLILDGDLF